MELSSRMAVYSDFESGLGMSRVAGISRSGVGVSVFHALAAA